MRYYYIMLAIYSFFYPYKNIAESNCDNIEAAVYQQALNEGFHREIVYTVTLSEQGGRDIWTPGVCTLCLKQTLPPGAYVDPNELRELKRFQKVHACALGDVDVEKPKHMSRNTLVHMYAPIQSAHVNIRLPIHLRYHKAKANGSYERVKINQPWVLLRCPNNVFRMCNPGVTIIAPCSECSPHSCSWHNITNDPLSSKLDLKVPVGNLNDFTFVALITVVVCFFGCIYVVILLCKVNLVDHKSTIVIQNRYKKKN